MGGNQSREENESVRIANETELPVCYVISEGAPLYYGVIQPGDRITRQTGRVWFSVSTFPYTGAGEPTYDKIVANEIFSTLFDVLRAVTKGRDKDGNINSMMNLFQKAIKPQLDGNFLSLDKEPYGKVFTIDGQKYVVNKEFADKLDQTLNRVSKHGHYANGDWLHVRGGPKADQDWHNWESMRFEG